MGPSVMGFILAGGPTIPYGRGGLPVPQPRIHHPEPGLWPGEGKAQGRRPLQAPGTVGLGIGWVVPLYLLSDGRWVLRREVSLRGTLQAGLGAVGRVLCVTGKGPHPWAPGGKQVGSLGELGC